MKPKLTYAFVFLSMLYLPHSLVAATASSVSQYGVTWTFDRQYEIGQYVNGDYWVVGPVNITGISPQPCANGQNGSMVNPGFVSQQGYDNRIRSASNYDANLCDSPPMTLNPGDTICSAVSAAQKLNSFTWVRTVAVLTVVDVPQSPDKFRPPYSRPTRIADSSQDPYSFSANDIQWNLLPRFPRSEIASLPSLASSFKKVQRAWIDHVDSWVKSDSAPYENIPSYGQWIGEHASEVGLQLLLDYPIEELKPTMYGFVQAGIDLYGLMKAGGTWSADAGIYLGRKWPILFAGIMLNEPGMKSLPKRASTGRFLFQEDGQTYYFDDPELPEYVDAEGRPVSSSTAGAQKVRGVTGWHDKASGGSGDTVMWRLKDGNSFGIYPLHEFQHPNLWANNAVRKRAESYRRCCSSHAFVGMALAARLMGAEELWDHAPFFDYVERWMTQEETEVHRQALLQYNIDTSGWAGQGSSRSSFVDEMWAKYSGVTVTPTPSDDVPPAAPTGLRVAP